ncbi:uncharacterized protein BKA78DRAFT_300751 [Phyllosticta capitalensis]|uniref:uncharacterized protein n=1 Tax=Phyllosticta capitalensis TaxID=121624 RepID=UPI00312F3820
MATTNHPHHFNTQSNCQPTHNHTKHEAAMPPANFACHSETSVFSDSSMSSYEPPVTFWFYEQRDFPPMRASPHQAKARVPRVCAAIKTSLKRVATGHLHGNKTTKPRPLSKIRSLFPSRCANRTCTTSGTSALDPKVEPSYTPRPGMELSREDDDV